MEDKGKGGMNPSTAPRSGETENRDRMEGSFAPGISEYGPDHPRAPKTHGTEPKPDPERDEDADEEKGRS